MLEIQNWPSFVEDMTQTFWLTFFLDMLYNFVILVHVRNCGELFSRPSAVVSGCDLVDDASHTGHSDIAVLLPSRVICSHITNSGRETDQNCPLCFI